MRLHLLYLQIIFVSCQEFPPYDSDDVMIGNLRKREVIPLTQINRRWFDSNELKYRRTKDFQEDAAERKLEMIKSQLREARLDNAKLEKLHRQLRWMPINDNEVFGIGIR